MEGTERKGRKRKKRKDKEENGRKGKKRKKKEDLAMLVLINAWFKQLLYLTHKYKF